MWEWIGAVLLLVLFLGNMLWSIFGFQKGTDLEQVKGLARTTNVFLTVVFLALFVRYMQEITSNDSHEEVLQQLHQLGGVTYLHGEADLYRVDALDNPNLEQVRIYAPVGLWTIHDPIENDTKIAWLKAMQSRVRNSAFTLEAAYGLPPSGDNFEQYSKAVCVLAGFAHAKRTTLRVFEAAETTGFAKAANGLGMFIAEYDPAGSESPDNAVYFSMAAETPGHRVDSATVVRSPEAFSMARNWWDKHWEGLSGKPILPESLESMSPDQLAKALSDGKVESCADWWRQWGWEWPAG